MHLQEIREYEKQSHIDVYTNFELYSDGSWLKKPVKTIMDLLPHFSGYTHLNVLDLGCGVGRNSIAVAKYFSSIPCRVDCVDILDLAVEKLSKNAEQFGVSHSIHGILSPIDAFTIPSACYDLIIAISALEHMDSKDSLIAKLREIKGGIRENGIICLVMNSEIKEYDITTGAALPAQFEVNLLTDELQDILCKNFPGWEICKLSRQHQQYEIPRKNHIADLQTTVVTFVARKRDGK